MPVPDYQTLMLPVLRQFAEGRTNVSDCLPALKNEFCITEDEAAELIPSGRVTVLANRAHWARTYLGKAGLLRQVQRNHHEVTQLGRSVLDRGLERIDNQTLSELPGFEEWRRSKDATGEGSETGGGDPLGSAARAVSSDDRTPEEHVEASLQAIHADLAEDILVRVLELSSARFEKLIVDLLIAMGYGRGNPDAGRAIGRSGDGGIDGIINEDALGLDAVYIQAKRYAPDNKVGRPAIQQFVGSLTGESATKGVFVTTSDFSAEATNYVSKVQQRIVLVNGRQLARLMIANEIGVRTRQVYRLRSVDEDYFIDV